MATKKAQVVKKTPEQLHLELLEAERVAQEAADNRAKNLKARRLSAANRNVVKTKEALDQAKTALDNATKAYDVAKENLENAMVAQKAAQLDEEFVPASNGAAPNVPANTSQQFEIPLGKPKGFWAGLLGK